MPNKIILGTVIGIRQFRLSNCEFSQLMFNLNLRFVSACEAARLWHFIYSLFKILVIAWLFCCVHSVNVSGILVPVTFSVTTCVILFALREDINRFNFIFYAFLFFPICIFSSILRFWKKWIFFYMSYCTTALRIITTPFIKLSTIPTVTYWCWIRRLFLPNSSLS